MTDTQILSRVTWGCLSVYCIACIVWGCGLVAAAPHDDSKFPQRPVVRGGREGKVGERRPGFKEDR